VATLGLAVELRNAGYRHTAEWLEACVISYQRILGFTNRDRDAILEVLVDPPDELAQLRELLLQEHVDRQRIELEAS
jgi:hypothetical protein